MSTNESGRGYTSAAAHMFVILWPGAPAMGLDAGLLDEIEAVDSGLELSVGDLNTRIDIEDGPDAAKRIAEQLAPYTRGSPIESAAIYEDAKRRVEELDAGRGTNLFNLFVGDFALQVEPDLVRLGEREFDMGEIEARAMRGENLSLQHGGRVQAALVWLVVAAERRPGGRQGRALLEARIADYERQHRTPGS